MMANRSWTLYVCETCQATSLRDESWNFPHGGPACWCRNTAPRLMTAVEVVPRESAEALAEALRVAWLGEPNVPARFSNRLHGPTHNCSPDACMIGQCPTVRALLAIYPKAEEESDGQ